MGFTTSINACHVHINDDEEVRVFNDQAHKTKNIAQEETTQEPVMKKLSLMLLESQHHRDSN